MRAVLDVVVDGAAAESERLLHGLLRLAGVTGWQANLAVVEGGELLGVADVAFRRHRLAVEFDGLAFHVTRSRFERDRARQNRFVRAGWCVLRYTWDVLPNQPGVVLAEITDILQLGETYRR